MSQTTKLDTEALEAALWKKLDQLPQRDAIEVDDARQWIKYMANVMPDEAMWHMIRAGGVGGSEIGGLVRNFMGHRADHMFSAHDWALGKLLRKTPEPSFGVLRRGHEMEPIHAKRFYEETGSHRDLNAYNTLSNAQGQAIWMRYSPDDLVRFNVPYLLEQGYGPALELQGLILVDYKSPTQVDTSDTVSFQYACQLHQGAMLAIEKGIELNGCLLSQFNWATWSLKNSFIEINPELCQLVRQAGDHYWDDVMNGRIPRYVLRNTMQLDPSRRERYQKVAERLAVINAMRTELDKASEALRNSLVNGIKPEQERFDGQVIDYNGVLKITAPMRIDEEKARQLLGENALESLYVTRPELKEQPKEVIDAVRDILGEQAAQSLMTKEKGVKYDTKALVERLKELGEDVKPYRITEKMDPEKVFNALLEAGLDPEQVITEAPRVTIHGSVRQRAQQWFNQSFPALELPEEAPTEDAYLEMENVAPDEAPAATAPRPRG